MDIKSPKAVLACAFAAAVFYFLIFPLLSSDRKIQRHGRPLTKAPDTLPLAGNGIVFLQSRQKLFSWFVKCERQAGYETLEISVPTLPPGVIISDPKNLDFVFKHEGTFSKGSFVKQRSWDLFGYGIINADGELWKAQRKAGLAFLSTANLRILTDVALPQYLSHAVERLTSLSDGNVVDLQKIFHEITTQLMGKMAYNMEMHADDAFAASFDFASGATAERFQNPLWFVTEIFLGAKFRKSVKTVKAFGRHIVFRATAGRQSVEGVRDVDPSRELRGPNNTTDKNDNNGNKLDHISGSLIQSLLDSIPDQQVVSDAALNYLSAGRDTTAQALTWSFYLLMKHPSALSRIRDEVQEVLRCAGHLADLTILTSKTMDGVDSQPDAAATTTSLFSPTSMPYTLAVFYETIRFYPPVPFEIKQCTKPTTLPDGTHLPADSVVVWCPWAMNRSLTTWGRDADIFRPERWLSSPPPPTPTATTPTLTSTSPPPPPSSLSSPPDGRQARPFVVNRSAAEFPVFNGGPRLCLGKKMAELVAVQVIATMAWLFDFVPADDGGGGGGTGSPGRSSVSGGDGERVSKSSLTLPMEGGLPVLVKPR